MRWRKSLKIAQTAQCLFRNAGEKDRKDIEQRATVDISGGGWEHLTIGAIFLFLFITVSSNVSTMVISNKEKGPIKIMLNN